MAGKQAVCDLAPRKASASQWQSETTQAALFPTAVKGAGNHACRAYRPREDDASVQDPLGDWPEEC